MPRTRGARPPRVGGSQRTVGPAQRLLPGLGFGLGLGLGLGSGLELRLGLANPSPSPNPSPNPSQVQDEPYTAELADYTLPPLRVPPGQVLGLG